MIPAQSRKASSASPSSSTHTRLTHQVNYQQLTTWSKYRSHRSGCDKLPRDSNVSFLAYKIAIFVLLMVLQFTPVNSCMVWLYSACTGQEKIQKALVLEASSIPWHLVNPPVVLMSEWQTICRSSSQLFQIWGRGEMNWSQISIFCSSGDGTRSVRGLQTRRLL